MTPQLYALRASARTFIQHYHPLVFFLAIVLLFAGVATSLYLVSVTPTDTSAQDASVAGFDQKTVDQIKNLHDSADSADKLVFPTPRSNPFVEK